MARVRTSDSAICQVGGVTAVMRRNISIGVKNGIRDSVTESGLSGLPRTTGKNTKPRISGIITGKARLCASCWVFTADPTAAYSAP